jgi:putative oxidoreductase
VVLRVTVALLLIIHGVARASLGIVDDFGVFLGSVGLPFGPAVAWLLTVVEIAGGLALAAGVLVLPLCVWFAVELATGIALVHAPNGWFVVGAGRNGVEFSVLLIACLVVIALEHGGRRRSSS